MPTLDLHGQTWAEGLAEFIEIYNDTLRQTGGAIDVVHGYGSTGEGGILRTRLRAFLQRYEAHLEFSPGEEVDANQGHTVVVPKTPLPGLDAMLAERVWDYCQKPKARGKIMGRFRRHGQPKTKQAIRSLERQGRLRMVKGRRETTYQSVAAPDQSAEA